MDTFRTPLSPPAPQLLMFQHLLKKSPYWLVQLPSRFSVLIYTSDILEIGRIFLDVSETPQKKESILFE